MGGRGRSRTQRKHFRQSRENVWKRSKSDDSANATPDDANTIKNPTWEPFATQNPTFDEYYKEQEIVPAEEWDSFMDCLRKPLPAAFRINSSSQFYKDIRLQLENDFAKSLQAEDADGIEVEPIKPLPWYPDNLAWQSNFSRNQLRKNQILERFHEFLKLENEIGNITRQEAVSMVPPLLLDVRPDHFVLDMCAAPGSKTFQLLEMIYKLTEPGTLPSGMVIANDLDVQRCNLLIHQTKRMCTANLIVTNHEAQHFPSCHLHRNLGNSEAPGIRQLQFDRVLCDVPCSGDGTLRKAPDIWRKWNSGMGNVLHGLQVQIAMRGLALLKVGGRMVYSTCSMNPVENEAVVAEVLRRCEGTVELVDVSTELPQLARRPGIKKWKVRDRGQWWASYKDVPKYRKTVVSPGMFPSGKSCDETPESDQETATKQFCENSDPKSENGHELLDDSVAPTKNMEVEVSDRHELMDDTVAPTKNMEAEVSDLPLERCMRIVPHDQNSGAFFIAVLHKLSPLPATAAASQKKSSSISEKADTKVAEAQELNEMKEDKNGDDVVLSGDGDNQISEITPDADSLDTGTDETQMNPDQNTINEQNEKVETEPSPDVKTDAKPVAGKRKLQIQGRWRGVDPVIFYKDEAVVGKIIEFYGVKESLPLKGHLISRNSDINHVKRIYYISDSVKEVLQLNFLSGQQLKIAAVGLKMFERQTSKDGASAPCLFRISSEGLPLILPHISKQILYASPIDFDHLLKYKSIKLQDFVDPDFAEKATQLLMGCCAIILKREGNVSSDFSQDDTPIAIGCWRGRTNISVMVTAIDCQELLERVAVLRSAEEASKANGSSSIPMAVEDGKTNGSDIAAPETEKLD